MINAIRQEYVNDIKFKSVEDFLRSITYGGELYDLLSKNFVFRGHESNRYSLLPSLLRPVDAAPFFFEYEGEIKEYDCNKVTEALAITGEFAELYSFYNFCNTTGLYVPHIQRLTEAFNNISTHIKHGKKWPTPDLIELIALAQHHGIRTRFLDWTSNINVALYFASVGAFTNSVHNNEVADESLLEIWGLDLSFLDDRRIARDCPMKVVRPHYGINKNLSAQKGLFTYWEIETPEIVQSAYDCQDDSSIVDRTPLDRLVTDYLNGIGYPPAKIFCHITLPTSGAKELYVYAGRNMCDAAHLFPGYDGVVRCMNEDRMFRIEKYGTNRIMHFDY